ncbi:LOW QUALITY PROTEIN: L-fucose dehydrogenase [Molossus nigricans]
MATGSRYARKGVIVTGGGGRGIGAGIVRALELGGRVLEKELPGTVFCDGAQEEDVRALVSETVCCFGCLDCVVNNAGCVSHPPPQWPEETSAQGFRPLLELNLLGTPTSTKLTLPHLRKSRGNVINISSLVGAIGQSQAVPHVATKGALTAMTKTMALDDQYGVQVNCVSPDSMWEELASSTPAPKATVLEGTVAQPLGRMGQPAEVGAAAVSLAPEPSFCPGIELLVRGYGCKARWGTPVEAPAIPS